MAKYARQQDLIDQVHRLQEQVRRLQTRSRGVTSHTKTFLISGPIAAGFQPPGFIVSTQPTRHSDEPSSQAFPQDIRTVMGVSGRLLDGECYVDFYVNASVIYSGLHVTATRPPDWAPVAHDLSDGDMLSIVVASADDAALDLSAVFLMTLEPWE